jgi:hypothetical protein
MHAIIIDGLRSLTSTYLNAEAMKAMKEAVGGQLNFTAYLNGISDSSINSLQTWN